MYVCMYIYIYIYIYTYVCAYIIDAKWGAKAPTLLDHSILGAKAQARGPFARLFDPRS